MRTGKLCILRETSGGVGEPVGVDTHIAASSASWTTPKPASRVSQSVPDSSTCAPAMEDVSQ